MDDLEHLATTVHDGLAALQKAQELYDEYMWEIADPKFANLRHIQIHLAKTVGKLAGLIEPQDHRVHSGALAEPLEASDVAPIVADLLIHAAQIANIHHIDLGTALAERYRKNASRFAPASALVKFGSK